MDLRNFILQKVFEESPEFAFDTMYEHIPELEKKVNALTNLELLDAIEEYLVEQRRERIRTLAGL